MKSKKTIIGIAAIAVIVLWLMSGYNSMVNVQEEATTALADVQSAYKRRADLIPNLVNVVKGYAEHEKGTLEGVINARAKATQITLDPNNLTPEKLQEFQAAQGELSQALGRLMVVQEQYPELKANENFKDLQTQLEGTENRINEMRINFNKVVEKYNKTVRSFPKNLLAGIFGFDRMSKFEATEKEMETPEVKF
jgi:LemA protein